MNEGRHGLDPYAPDLGGLDPGRDDPTYWYRFQARVMEAALPELARRRRMGRTTMVDVMSSWSRLVAPVALAAAAMALVFLADSGASPEFQLHTERSATERSADVLLGVEDLLLPAAEAGNGAQRFFDSEVALDRDDVLLMVEGYREP